MYVCYLMTLSVLKLYGIGRIRDERWIGKDLEESPVVYWRYYPSIWKA
jgi:hypothetical protein